MSTVRRFKCVANPRAPLLVLDSWEAEEMRRHPDYVEVDEHGDLVLDGKPGPAPTIPFSPVSALKATK